jgi:hypothetical protein
MDSRLCSLSFFGFVLKDLAKLFFAILLFIKSSRDGLEQRLRCRWFIACLTLDLSSVFG